MKYSLNQPEVTGYIDLLQGIINRMAGNSANCKNWAITLIVAIFALSDTEGWTRFFICLGATSIFYFLDCFYLGLEQRFIRMQRSFVMSTTEYKSLKVETKEDTQYTDTPQIILPYLIERSGWKEQLKGVWHGMCSISTTPLYLILALLTLVFVHIQPNSTTSDDIHAIVISPQNLHIDHAYQEHIDITEFSEKSKSIRDKSNVRP